MLEWLGSHFVIFVSGFGTVVALLLWLSMRGEGKAQAKKVEQERAEVVALPAPVQVPTYNEAKEVERVDSKLQEVEDKAHREPAPSDNEFNDFLRGLDAKQRRSKP